MAETTTPKSPSDGGHVSGLASTDSPLRNSKTALTNALARDAGVKPTKDKTKFIGKQN